MSRRPSKDDSDEELRWFHGKISRQETEDILSNNLYSFYLTKMNLKFNLIINVCRQKF